MRMAKELSSTKGKVKPPTIKKGRKAKTPSEVKSPRLL